MTEITFQPLGDPLAAGEALERVADIDAKLTRTHFFDGRLLTAIDLERDQQYLDQRLREVGKVIGSGVLDGLSMSFEKSSGLLTVESGHGISAGGRVLHLDSRLIVDLDDRSLISQLNSGQYRQLNRALYCVVLKYVEVATDVAEVFPTDLSTKRGADYALVTEAVQLGLVPLPIAQPQQSELKTRASLIAELADDSTWEHLIPYDSISLGIVAISQDQAQWIDAELTRKNIHELQGDFVPSTAMLARRYCSVYKSILSERLSGALNNDFAATDYFTTLPPSGLLPKDTINPMQGTQHFFPENYKVNIAPVRQSDLALIEEESLLLPPLQLRNGLPEDVVVLVPLTDESYGYFSQQLERGDGSAEPRIASFDLLRLYLYPRTAVHEIDTDETAWQEIWSQLVDHTLVYVRRPVRAAETGISGIVLAQGAELPPPAETPAPSEVPSGDLIEDEDTVFLRFINFEWLSKAYPPTSTEEEKAFEKLANNFKNDALFVRKLLAFFVAVERQYQAVIWRTSLLLADAEGVETFLEKIESLDFHPASTGKRLHEMLSNMSDADSVISELEDIVSKLSH
jgi:hypothetical protein